MRPFSVVVDRKDIRQDAEGWDYVKFEIKPSSASDILEPSGNLPSFYDQAVISGVVFGKSATMADNRPGASSLKELEGGYAVLKAEKLEMLFLRSNASILFSAVVSGEYGEEQIIYTDFDRFIEEMRRCAEGVYRISPFVETRDVWMLSLDLLSLMLKIDHVDMPYLPTHTSWTLDVKNTETRETVWGYYTGDDPGHPDKWKPIYNLRATFKRDEIFLTLSFPISLDYGLVGSELRDMLLNVTKNSLDSIFGTSVCSIARMHEGKSVHMVAVNGTAPIPGNVGKIVVGGSTIIETEIHPPVLHRVMAELEKNLGGVLRRG